MRHGFFPLILTVTLAFSGCVDIPFLFSPYRPYNESPLFTFDRPIRWGDGNKVSGGIEFKEPHGRVSMAIVYLKEGDPGYKPAPVYRQNMSQWGAVDDSHVVSEIIVSSHTAYRVRFTTYKYDPEYLLGTKTQVLYTEVVLIPLSKGICAVRYAGKKKYFWKKSYRKYYDHFLQTLLLSDKK